MKELKSLSSPLLEEDFGAKAATLSKMLACGFNVPNGFAISKQVYLDFKDGTFSEASFSESLSSQLLVLEADKVIVRSSGIGEDSSSHSFAGQMDSFVVARSLEEVLGGIKDCWRGLDNERLQVYRKMAKRDLREMGVIVQNFIEPDFAGVTFTESPNLQSGMYTEFVLGRGENLVSGAITPETILHSEANNTRRFPFDFNRLEEKCRMLSSEFGCPLDIEWLIKDEELIFVQARPITVRRSKVYWSNTNLNENYPNPISPLLYSIARDSYYHYFKNLAGLLQIEEEAIRALEYDFSNVVGTWGNRIYYNMTSIHNILSSSPLKPYFIDAFNKFVGYEDRDTTTKDRSKTTSILKFLWNLIRLNTRLSRYVKEIEEMVGEYSQKCLKGDDDKDLFYAFLDIRFNQWYRASVADLFAMLHYKLLAKITQKFYGPDAVGVHNKLLQAIPNLISTEPLNEIYSISKEIEKVPGGKRAFLEMNDEELLVDLATQEKWADVQAKVNSYLERWGFRCSGELMFFSKNYIEDPASFIRLLKGYLSQNPVDPTEVHRLKSKERRKALTAFVLKIVKRRHIFLPLSILEIVSLLLVSRWCKKAISSRERVRYRQAELYFRFKQSVLRVGGQDYFYLSYKEIGELISSSGMFTSRIRERIQERKVEFKKVTQSFPENFSTFFGERPSEVKEKVALDPNAKLYSGIAASGGQVRARVVVLESVLEGSKIEEGDILVTKQTDPGWAMVFPLIGGLIVERGGALSHGAIVAREFGIPAVVGVNSITKILQDGDYVLLDGDVGKIQLL